VSLTRDELADFIAEHFGLDRSGLENNVPLFSSSLLDSASLVTIVAFLEERTGLTFEASDLSLDNFDTISAILSFCSDRRV